MSDARWPGVVDAMSPPLADDEVHVWTASLDRPEAEARRLESLLALDERRRADRFRFARDRSRFVVGRGLLRTILARYMGRDPRRLEFQYGAHGKPTLVAGPSQGTPRFNLSHSGGLALYGIARGREIGVDVEALRPLPEALHIAERFFAPGERACLRAIPTERRTEAFFTCWTRKEAYVKGLGSGFGYPLDRFQVSLAPGAPAELLRVDGDPLGTARWSLRVLDAGAGYVAALAVEGSGWSLRRWRVPAVLIGEAAIHADDAVSACSRRRPRPREDRAA